ncbi:MAG: tRNA lysidine(34) synthetase TilS [Deltaproteobacteria bacterium]|nr:tRNA lysidine(34) synthetase TilS [Deltaproteobacteria bacterium]
MLLASVEAALGRLGVKVRRVLVAVSGGIDSTVLLDALATLQGPLRLTLALGHVHHGLRGLEADADERSVRTLADKLGLASFVARIDPGSLREGRSNRERPTLQEAARQLRYQALQRMADEWPADHIATAHNLNDQAETVLMRLLRGTSPDGLGGIPEASPDRRVVRPLLAVTREEIESFARERHLLWREDASNAGDAYTRNRIRHHWLPALTREFNPQLLRVTGNLAEAQRRDSEWLATLVEAAAPDWITKHRGTQARGPGEAGGEEGDRIELAARGWDALPEALARRLVVRALGEMGAGRDVTRTHIRRMLDFMCGGAARETGKTLELPGGLELRQERSSFVLRRGRGGRGE